MQTFVAVHWQWLGLPLLVWTLTAITWIGTAVFTAQARLKKWRSNVIPLLLLYRGRESRVEVLDGASMGTGTLDAEIGLEGHDPGVSNEAFESRAESIQAKLVLGWVDARLV